MAFFVAIGVEKPHGIMESWNAGILGMKSGKRSILPKMLYLHFMMMSIRHPFSAFSQENTPLLRANQYNYISLDSLNPPLQYSLRTAGSTLRGAVPVPYWMESSRRPEPMIPSFQLRNEVELSSLYPTVKSRPDSL